MKKDTVFIALKNYDLPNNLAEYGIKLSEKLKLPAYFFGVAQPSAVFMPMGFTTESVLNPMADEMTAVQGQIRKKLRSYILQNSTDENDLSFGTDIGFLEPKIVEQANEKNPFLVMVQGESETTTVTEWFGTYETRLAENIDAPVLVVPKNHEEREVNKILYLMDLDDHKVENMRFLSGLSNKLDVELSILVISTKNINDDDDKYHNMVKVMTTLLGYTKPNFHRIHSEDPAQKVKELMDQVSADWLALEHKSKSFFERIFDNYNTKKLVLQSEKPVLVF